MDPLTLGLIGGGIGLLKDQGDAANAKNQNLLNAQIMRYSPWTKMTPSTTLGHSNPMGNALQYGVTGAMLGQSLDKANAAGASSPDGTTGGESGNYNPQTYGSYDMNTGVGQPYKPIVPSLGMSYGKSPWAGFGNIG